MKDLMNIDGSHGPEARPQPLTAFDGMLLWILQLYGAVTLAALALVPRSFLPAEDAVILFQYSRNLAEHGAITFLAGGPHVEGATDFAWMVLIAGAIRCGVQPFWFCAMANVASLLALAAVLLRMAGMHRAGLRAGMSRMLMVAGAAGLFRQIFAAASGFAVLPNALLLSLLVLFVTRGRPALASITALVLCLFRPDGVVLAVPLLLYLVLHGKVRGAGGAEVGARLVAALFAVALFAVPGALYFVWRWHYFGELFPLPFLVKADFRREFGFLVAGSVRASLVPLLFTVVVITPVLLLRKRANLWLAAALIAVPTLFYWMVRLDQNVGSRFFSYLPVAAALLLALNRGDFTRRVDVFRIAFAAWLLLLAAPLYRELLTFRYMQFADVKSIAEALGSMPRHGTILASEAGFVPFYSGWAATDPWGLNTPEFAHRFFQPWDVARIGADLVVLHPDLSESCVVRPEWKGGYLDRSWPHMTRNLIMGASGGRYELWLTSYGSEFYRQRKHWGYGEGDRECWLVRTDSPLRGEIEGVLRDHHGVPPGEALLLENRRSGSGR